jgi:transcription elongation factor Elf1
MSEQDYSELFSLITERPDPSLDWNKPTCPKCGSTNVPDDGVISTLVGWFPAKPEDDRTEHPGNPNSSLRVHHCADCGFDFNYGVKYGNVYVEDDKGKILRGIPTGVPVNRRFTCAHCGGDVTVKDCSRQKIYTPPCQHKFTCVNCDKRLAIAYNGYQPPYTYKNAFADVEGPIQFEEKEGLCLINSHVLEKANKLLDD